MMQQHLSVRNATVAAKACAAFRFVVWLVLMLSYPAVSYTIGLMQSGSFDNSLVVVWACFLLGCSDGIATCSVDGSDNQARIMLNQATQVLYVLLLLLSYMRSLHRQLKILLLLLWLLNVVKLGMRLLSLLSAGREQVLTTDNWIISKYMGHKQVSSVNDFDPETMKGYNVEDNLDATDEYLVTVDKVWQCEGSLLGNKASAGSKFRDLCLSFALFKLLWRRLSRSPLHEPRDIRTAVFVRRGIAGGDRCQDHERMFRLIEVELGFLYDFHFARYPSPKQTLIPETAMFGAAMALGLCTLFSSPLLRYSSNTNPAAAGDSIVSTGLDIWLARLVIVLFVILELFQYLSLVLSDWHKVKLLCRYVRRRSWHGRRSLEALLWLVCRATLTTSFQWRHTTGSREEVVLADGIRLGSLIPAKMPDEALRWNVLAEMWVELLLTVAPSENVSAHVKKLAAGGELITHLWALLTHGGMIKKPSRPCYSDDSSVKINYIPV
ncbi:hypothetical protein PVAP13_2KG363500 [Panicum virgatum]|uniref:DUF4220 domain-containing protein n=1 Tax=Panicum virgatum TaxID=38727 RepID=A0A8T0WJB8_PANVG|nr:hypothetical protein PVAP13_2KG363500 [Panicum virgatum]